MSKFIFILILLFGAQTGNASEVRFLGEVFCAQWYVQHRQGMDPLSSQAAWEAFVQTVELGELPSGVPAPWQARCQSAFEPELERGEFLLGGRRLVEKTLEEHQLNRNRVAQLQPRQGSVTLPDFGEVSIGGLGSFEPAGLAQERIQMRVNRYQQLWGEFLADLRKTMTDRRELLTIN